MFVTFGDINFGFRLLTASKFDLTGCESNTIFSAFALVVTALNLLICLFYLSMAALDSILTAIDSLIILLDTQKTLLD